MVKIVNVFILLLFCVLPLYCNESLTLTKITSKKDQFILEFNREVERNEIKDYNLNTKEFYRRVYDIKGTLKAKIPTMNNKISPQLRISQFKKGIIRIVFAGETKQQISYKSKNNILTFKNDTKNTQSNTAKSNNSSKTTTKISNKTQDSKTQKIYQNTKKTKIIVLDPGHGGKDVGAKGNGLYEKNVVLKIAKKTSESLAKKGYKVYLTRSNDKFISLRQRTGYANDKKADLFISIHANASPTKEKASSMSGLETFFLSPSRSERAMRAANLENKSDTEEMNYFTKISFLNFLNREKIIASNKLAIDIQNGILKDVRSVYKINDGGVREGPFWVLVGALMPAVLVEIGYISNKTDSSYFEKAEYIEKMSQGIANGVESYFAKNK